MKRSVRRLLWLLLAAWLLAPAWVLGTTSGLRAVASVAGHVTGGRLTIADVDGRLLDDIHVRGLAWHADSATIDVDDAVVNLRLSRLLLGRIQAEQLVVGTLRVTTRASAPPAQHTPLTVRMPLRLAVEDGRLAAFRLRLAGVQKDWAVTGASFVAHWRDEWIVVGTLRATLPEVGAAQLRGRVAIVEDLLQLEDVEAAGLGTLHAKGAIAIADESSNALDVSWRNLVLPAGWAPWLSSSQGESRLEGPWRNYGWRAKGHAQLRDVPSEFDAHGRGDLKSITVQHFDIAALAGTLAGDARVEWSPGLTTAGTVQWRKIDPASVWPEWPGKLNGEARLQARWGKPIQLEFDGALRDSQLRGYPFALHATGKTEDAKVFLRELALRSGESRLTAHGQLLPEMALAGELHSEDLRTLWAGLSGRVHVKATAAGTFAQPRLTANGAIDDIVYRRYRIDHGDLDASVALHGNSHVTLQLAGLDVGVPLKSFRLEGEGTRASHRLRLASEGRDSSARVGFEGGERAGGWRGRIVAAEVRPPRGVAWSLEEPAPLSFARGRFESEPACLASGASRACAQLGFAPDRTRIAFRTRDFDLQHVRPWLPAEWNLTGAVTGSAAFTLARGELTDVRADLAATAGFIEGGGVRLDFEPGRLDIETEESLLHAHLQLRPARGLVDADIWVSPGKDLLDRPMLGDLKLALPDLTWLPVLSPEIAAAEGALDAALHVSGTPRSPSLDGALHLTGGRVQLTTPGIELTGITASFERGRGEAPLKLHAQATSGEGPITLDGEFRTLQPKLAGELTIKGQNVLGVSRPDIKAWLSPDLKLVIDGSHANLTGELGVPRALITPRELSSGGVAPSGDQVLIEHAAEDATGQARGVRVESEVRIALGDDVKFDGLGLKTKLTGAITAYDDPERPTRGRGELRLDGGRYKAYGQELQIETGRLIFAGGPVSSPAIDITAVRKPREDIKVGLHARGTLEAPEFSLFSEPAMAQEEQLSWLVLGRSLSATLDSNQRGQLSSAAVSLGFTGGEYLAQQLAPKLGLDEVSLGAKPGETTDLARFTIGKYLSPKLFVSYGYGIFQPGHFFRMQYDLGRRFKLIGESGVTQGGDIMYTIER